MKEAQKLGICSCKVLSGNQLQYNANADEQLKKKKVEIQDFSSIPMKYS